MKNTSVIIVVVSVLGFMITGLLGYPFQVDYDSSHLISSMLADESPNITNWMGWLYPSIIYLCYFITGYPLAIGIFNSLFYWIGISLFCIALFNDKKRPVLWYMTVALFPGSLAFITSITNNATLFVTTLMGIGMYMYYRKISGCKWFLWVSIAMLVSAIFIRREALIYVLLILIYIYVKELCGRNETSLKSVIAGIALSVFSISICLIIEHRLTMKIPGYHVINTIGFTALFDLNGMSHYKGEVLIPRYIFREECQNDSLLKSIVLQYNDDFYSDSGKGCFWSIDENSKTLKQSPWLTNLTLDEVAPIYIKNIKYYVLFRFTLLKKYMYTQLFTVYGMDDLLKIKGVNGPSIISTALGSIALLTGILLNYVWIALIALFANGKKYVSYKNGNERWLCIGIWILLILIILLYMASVPSIQIRYVYPPCLFIWYFSMYTLSLLTEKRVQQVL